MSVMTHLAPQPFWIILLSQQDSLTVLTLNIVRPVCAAPSLNTPCHSPNNGIDEMLISIGSSLSVMIMNLFLVQPERH